VTASASQAGPRIVWSPPGAGGGLEGMRRAATGLLLVMAVVFVLAAWGQERVAALAFVKAFAEAALVGGLADWFAVTALFRHPLGLPIPHTAIIPRNKDRLGDSLALFLRQNFLIPQVVARRMQAIDVAAALGRFLETPRVTGGTRLREAGGRILADLLAATDDDQLGGLMKRELRRRLDTLNLAPLLGRGLGAAIAEDKHRPVIDAALGWARATLEANEVLVRSVVKERSNAILRLTGLDETVSTAILNGLKTLLTQAAEDREHPLRRRIEESLATLATDLQHDEEMGARVRRMTTAVLDNPAFAQWVDTLWARARQRMVEAARDPDSALAGQLGEASRALGATLLREGRLRHVINRLTRRVVAGAVSRYGDGLVRLISDTVRGWDAGTLTDRVEQAVGRDLQYIRVNGTLVGGLVGLGLFTGEWLLR